MSDVLINIGHLCGIPEFVFPLTTGLNGCYYQCWDVECKRYIITAGW